MQLPWRITSFWQYSEVMSKAIDILARAAYYKTGFPGSANIQILSNNNETRVENIVEAIGLTRNGVICEYSNKSDFSPSRSSILSRIPSSTSLPCSTMLQQASMPLAIEADLLSMSESGQISPLGGTRGSDPSAVDNNGSDYHESRQLSQPRMNSSDAAGQATTAEHGSSYDNERLMVAAAQFLSQVQDQEYWIPWQVPVFPDTSGGVSDTPCYNFDSHC